MKRTLFHSITILILSSLLKQQLLTTNQQKAIRQSKQGSPEDTCVSSEVHRVVAVLHNSNSRAKKQLHLENYILKNKEIKILNLWKVCEMCAGKKNMSGAFLQHVGTKFCFVNLSNLSYSTKRATDGEVCVLKGWQAIAECLWCQFYPFVIRQRGKMLMRTKLGVCFYQRVAYFTAPWLSISNIGY